MANVVGTAGNDFIDASDGVTDDADTIFGLAGIDTIFGLGGNDVINGGADADAIDGGFGNDTASYDDAGASVGVTVSLTTGTGSGGFAQGDTLTGIENLTGTQFADVLIGDFLANILLGLGGADMLIGGGGNDTLDGGDGDDLLSGGSGSDVMSGGAGIDTLSYASSPFVTDAATVGVTISLDYLGNGVGVGGFAAGDVFYGIENVIGSDFADRINGNGGPNELSGLGGNDTLAGLGGADILRGGADNDTYIVYSQGVTVIEEQNQGIDTVKSSVTYTLTPNVENLILTGAASASGTGNNGANTITGNFGKNVLSGHGGADTISGGYGKDTLKGEAGKDKLSSGDGADTLIGGLARDVMTGGAGKDTFQFDSIKETGKGPWTRDVITDFQHLVDVIFLNTIDANGPDVAGNGNFAFLGTKAFTGVAGQLRYFFEGPGKTIVAGDTDGNKVADFQIELTGHKALTAGDFVL